MDFNLNEEQLMIQKMARDFAQEQIVPRAEEMAETGNFPYDLISKMTDLGFMGLLAPPEWGGAGVDTVGYASALEEIAKADVALALTWQVHIFVTTMYLNHGTEEQKKKWVPRLTSGEILAAFALTEPNAGSDAAGMQTRAVLQGNEWVINGNKIFITNAGTDISDGLVLMAVSGEREGGKKEFSTFIIPRGTPGFIVGNKFNKIGWNAMDTRELIFEDCRVPQENMLGPRGAGLRQALAGLDLGRIAFGAAGTGIAQGCLELSLEHAKQRVQFGRPISQFQAIQFKLADMAVKVAAARSLTYKAAVLRDEGKPFSTEAAMAKLYATRICVEAADEAFQIHGGYGFMKEYAVSRYWRDCKIMEIGEGTNEIQRLVIARALGC